MAKLSGGLFSSPAGHNNGLVFGKARTKDGKRTTVRELVKPSNPNTNAQQDQRTRFTEALKIVKSFGRSIYQLDWNNAVGDLPGFHSMQSIFTNAVAPSATNINLPASATLGVRHFPDSFQAEVGADVIDVSWSTELGDIGAANDDVIILCVNTTLSGPGSDPTTIVDQTAVRSDGSASVAATGVSAGDFHVGMYLKTSQTGLPNDEIRSACEWTDLVAP